MSELEGKTIKRYKINQELGRGGMAVVYQAIDTMLDRRVAIKLILSENTSKEKTERLLKRFSREAKALASLSHPNIVKVLDYGEYETAPYLVMEYIGGGALRARLGAPIPFAEAAAMLVPVARALQHAHQKRIIHRDIKPENILINDSNQLLVSDFGILKLLDVDESQGLTGTGKIVGTYAYMSPEQIRGLEVDGRADMYSLGAVFFEMITGRKPFTAATPIQLSVQHLYDPVPKAKQIVRDLPSEVDQVITTALAKNPEARYPNMSAFAEALERLAALGTASKPAERRISRPVEEKKTTTPAPAARRRPVVPFFVGGALLLLAVAVALYAFRGSLPVAIGGAAATATAAPTHAVIHTAPASSPTPLRPTATKAPPTATKAPTQASSLAINPQNADRLIPRNYLDKISIIDMDWIENGNWLIDAGSSKISFIDAKTGTIEHAVSLPGEIPLSMGVSSAADKVYLLFNDNIKVIDIETFAVTNVFKPISGGARSIAVSPDGKLLALGISDNKTQLLSSTDGSVVRNLRSNYGGWTVEFSPDSQYIVSGTSQGVLRWETATGKWRPISGGQDVAVKSLAFSDDGKWIAAGGNGIILIWNMEDGRLLQQIEGNFQAVNGLDFSPDNSLLASATDDGLVRLWNPASGALVQQLTGHTSQVFDVCFSPDGQNIASGANEGSIRIWGLP